MHQQNMRYFKRAEYHPCVLVLPCAVRVGKGFYRARCRIKLRYGEYPSVRQHRAMDYCRSAALNIYVPCRLRNCRLAFWYGKPVRLFKGLHRVEAVKLRLEQFEVPLFAYTEVGLKLYPNAAYFIALDVSLHRCTLRTKLRSNPSENAWFQRSFPRRPQGRLFSRGRLCRR